MKLFKIAFITLFALTMVTSLVAQGTSTEAYKSEKEGWLVDIDEAYAEAKRTKKPILANFTGSDWCGWCKKLDKDVFNKPEFQKWAEENVVLLELDFPRRFKLPQENAMKNERVKQSFQQLGLVRGFPTILLFDISEKGKQAYDFTLLGKTGYTKTVAKFTGDVEDMMKLRGEVSQDYVVSYDANAPLAAAPQRKRTSQAKKPEPPQNAKGVWHYTCPKGCKGGAGAAEPCKSCKTELTHNAVYHQ